MSDDKTPWISANTVDEIPSPKDGRGKEMTGESKMLLDYLKAHKGERVGFKFDSEEKAKTMRNRIAYFKKQEYIDYKGLYVRGTEVFVDLT